MKAVMTFEEFIEYARTRGMHLTKIDDEGVHFDFEKILEFRLSPKTYTLITLDPRPKETYNFVGYIKEIRFLLGCSLEEAKAFAENANTRFEFKTEEEAMDFKRKIEVLGIRSRIE